MYSNQIPRWVNPSVFGVAQQIVSELNGKNINEVMNAGKTALHLPFDLRNVKLTWAMSSS